MNIRSLQKQGLRVREITLLTSHSRKTVHKLLGAKTTDSNAARPRQQVGPAQRLSHRSRKTRRRIVAAPPEVGISRRVLAA